MDQTLVDSLREAGIDPAREDFLPALALRLDPAGRPLPLDGEAVVACQGRSVPVRLKPVSSLFAGNALPPDFSGGPTKAYLPVFLCIEQAAAHYTFLGRTTTRDREFERLYDHLRRRPDGTDSNPLFSYLQAAVALQMSLRDLGRAEYEAVLRRLAKSARTFSDGYTSTYYRDRALSVFMDDHR